MNILVLSPFLPWPLDQGGKIRAYSIVRNLARHHSVTLAAVVDDRQAADAAPLEEFCTEVLTVERPARLWSDRIAFFTGSQPYNAIRYRSMEMEQTLRGLLRRKAFDLVQVEFAMMWQYAGLFAGVPVVLDAHNIEHRIVRQNREAFRSPFWRALYVVEERRLRSLEERGWRECALCFAVSDGEREVIASSCGTPEKVVTIPNGVDLERFGFMPKGGGGKRILFLGGMDYLPNLDSARFFLGEIFPRLIRDDPEVRLDIVGRELWRLPPELTGLPSVTRHENVPEVLPFFRNADLLAVPLRYGAGTRVKIMEAMAAGLPVVATSKGCEGIGARHGEHLLVADTSEDFAGAARKILHDLALKESIVNNARRLVEGRYSWQSLVGEMERHYGTVTHRR